MRLLREVGRFADYAVSSFVNAGDCRGLYRNVKLDNIADCYGICRVVTFLPQLTFDYAVVLLVVAGNYAVAAVRLYNRSCFEHWHYLLFKRLSSS